MYPVVQEAEQEPMEKVLKVQVKGATLRNHWSAWASLKCPTPFGRGRVGGASSGEKPSLNSAASQHPRAPQAAASAFNA